MREKERVREKERQRERDSETVLTEIQDFMRGDWNST